MAKTWFSKAQTATEYMIILAVVIIIALIVVGVMGGIPGIGKSTGSRTSSAAWKTADVGIDDYSFAATGGRILVKNNFAFPIRITDINISTVPTGSPTITFYAPDFTLEAGESKLISNLSLSGSNNPCGLTGVAPGDSYSINIRFKYTNLKTNAVSIFPTGTMRLEGQCVQSLT
ncbi:MAG: hypothetical protein QW594_02305 [Candidatus Woesearchaeota archaeon]